MFPKVNKEYLEQFLSQKQYADENFLFQELVQANKDFTAELPDQKVKLYTEAGEPPVIVIFKGVQFIVRGMAVIVNELFRLERDFDDVLRLPSTGPLAFAQEYRYKDRLAALEVSINRFMLLALGPVDFKFSDEGSAPPTRKIARLKLKLSAILIVASMANPDAKY